MINGGWEICKLEWGELERHQEEGDMAGQGSWAGKICFQVLRKTEWTCGRCSFEGLKMTRRWEDFRAHLGFLVKKMVTDEPYWDTKSDPRLRKRGCLHPSKEHVAPEHIHWFDGPVHKREFVTGCNVPSNAGHVYNPGDPQPGFAKHSYVHSTCNSHVLTSASVFEPRF